MKKNILKKWLVEALENYNGIASIVEICKFIWGKHENDLKMSGDLFFTWQYDLRWAACELRRNGIMKSALDSSKGIWDLV
jgi:hypothetical protein